MGRETRPDFVIFVVSSALIVGKWVVVAWSRKSWVELAEIISFVFQVLFKDGGCRVSPRFHLFVFNINQGKEEVGVSSRFPCVTSEMERFSLHFP